jgi:CRP/FNR family transcriptional regulator, transcriptional activator FtrB
MERPNTEKRYVRSAGDVLSSLSPFTGIEDEHRRSALFEAAQVELIDKGAVIFEQGIRPPVLIVAVSGLIEFFVTAGGRTTNLGTEQAPMVLLLAPVIRQGETFRSARAVSTMCLVRISADLVRATFKADAGFARAVAVVLAEQHHNAQLF